MNTDRDLQPVTENGVERRVSEFIVLFFSVLKWTLLASIVGVVVGFSTGIFLLLLEESILLTTSIDHYFFLLPFAMAASIMLVKRFAPDAEGDGMGNVIASVHKESGNIYSKIVPVKGFATIMTIAGGGSAGRVGPAAHIGAALSSLFSRRLGFDETTKRKVVICGISAGFASVFGTPVAGAVFGVEILFVGSVMYGVLLPSIVAGFVSHYVSSSMGVGHISAPEIFLPDMQYLVFYVLLAAFFFGLCSILYIEGLRMGKSIAKRTLLSDVKRALFGGIIIVLLAILFSTEYLGLGTSTIDNVLSGNEVIWYAFAFKILFTSVTLGFGGVGGIITPMLFVGATAGAALGGIFGFGIAFFAALGLVGVLAGATNTPLACTIMAAELFGASILPFAAIVCVVSFLMTGHRSAYVSQVLAIKKATTIDVELGREMGRMEPYIRFRKGTPSQKVSSWIFMVGRRIRCRLENKRLFQPLRISSKHGKNGHRRKHGRRRRPGGAHCAGHVRGVSKARGDSKHKGKKA